MQRESFDIILMTEMIAIRRVSKLTKNNATIIVLLPPKHCLACIITTQFIISRSLLFCIIRFSYCNVNSKLLLLQQLIMHPRPLGEAYSDRQLTLNFELWVEIEFWFVFWHHPTYVNISPTLVIGKWLERVLRVLQRGNPKIHCRFKKILTLMFLLSYFVNNF